MFGEMVDVPLADQFIKRNAIGVLRIPFGRADDRNYNQKFYECEA